MTERELIEQAQAVARNAYAPYSGFRVGAALETVEGKVFTGCNVENGSYSMTICAERNAVFHAVAEGYRKFRRIAIYVDADRLFSPCGACRQVLAEFADDLEIILASRQETLKSSLQAMLPMTFRLEPSNVEE